MNKTPKSFDFDSLINNAIPLISGIVFVLLGLLFSLIYILADNTDWTPGDFFSWDTLMSILNEKTIITEFFKEISIVLLVLGIFSLIIESQGWKDYFERALSRIVVKQAFLARLNRHQLIELQTNTLKAFFKDEELDREGSFLEYFTQRITQYVGEPYREGLRFIIKVDKIDVDQENGTIFKAYTRISYTCREAGGIIQDKVYWEIEKKEIKEIIEPFVSLRLKYSGSGAEQFKKEPIFSQKQPMKETQKPKYQSSEKADKTPENENQEIETVFLYEYDIKKYKDLDGLQVVIEGNYTFYESRFLYWNMAIPTKNVFFSVTYPNKYKLEFATFGSNPEDVVITQSEGCFSADYHYWMLPETGMAWKLLKRNATLPSP